MSCQTSELDTDFLVIGAGSAGCTVARVLSQRYRVILCESGTNQWASPQVSRPADYIKRFGTNDDWGFRTAPQKQLSERRLVFPRGKGLGGSTRINASIWLAPSKRDLVALADASENRISLAQLSESLRVVTQWVAPQAPHWLSPVTQAFLKSATSLHGVFRPFQRMNYRGQRRTAFHLVESAERVNHCKNVVANVRRLLIQKDKCVGVEIEQQGVVRKLHPRLGTILCAGTIGSPKILMQSGIGPHDRLSELGLPTNLDSPSVGCNLKDHLVFPIIVKQPSEHRPTGSAKFPTQWSARDLARWRCVGSGPCSSNLAEAGGFLQTNEGLSQIFVTPTDYLRHPTEHAEAAWTLGIVPCHPKSAGELRFTQPPNAKANSTDVEIDPAFLADSDDVNQLINTIHVAKQLLSVDPLAGMTESLLCPRFSSEPWSNRSITRSISRFAQSLYHPIGTCSMGKVVDGNGHLPGIGRLWVVDASILPDLPSGNPNALVMALAHRLATKITDARNDQAPSK